MLVGAALAAVGLVLVLDLLAGGVGVHPLGVLWALGAMVGAATYFVLSADDSGLPPLALAASGLLVGGLTLGVLGVLGV
ncbi:MAG TPA: EamA family transporter, partial [Actinotalea sp.]|nr:EamA family transporter [Actinotalea sp.]